ncbi:phospho-N-acetylmuramoyl-pentapeptide-transferase [Pseudalkalibacillus berkeleyi]|uniref:Phospho-N-acetylmuramoyl-pentapeptide-transferase n=1 Tax=Pseudalkalibacillus berkeleyi TaxID=1069813 RepID=A0ABS9H3E7_9BACL|nr:phospho-N-acetylmuramoyl-pentapeptide-transferase [Pseudalkalibacillus berkeleyi]MCF6138434.1 phospho-N-acetylmuramoyl-pentapeptide-transferase [Pseudalkalibacillus berkeleyi]
MSQQIIPAIIAFVLVSVLSPLFIALLRKLKLLQPIRKELPSNHQLKKGTPLMFGIILFVGIIVSILFSPTPLMLFLAVTYILFSFIGFLDDFWKASRQDPLGVSGKTKLVLQFIFTSALLFYVINIFGVDTEISIHKKFSFDLPMVVYIIVITLFVVGSANAINFTDGLDGLLGVVSIPTYFFFFVISDNSEVQLFCLIMIGSLLGFLIYNLYPAKAFMGDTGSLAIGGSLSFLAILEKVEILIPVLFFIYFAEKLSVILQVTSFKLTRKRIFRMTPIHFHYGLKYGWSENTIVTGFGFVSWFCTLICLAYWKFILHP